MKRESIYSETADLHRRSSLATCGAPVRISPSALLPQGCLSIGFCPRHNGLVLLVHLDAIDRPVSPPRLRRRLTGERPPTGGIRERVLEPDALAAEMLSLMRSIQFGDRAGSVVLGALPPELRVVKAVVVRGIHRLTSASRCTGQVSGDENLAQEPMRHLEAAIQGVIHVRAASPLPFFKLVLVADVHLLGESALEEALSFFSMEDELWVSVQLDSTALLGEPGRGLSKAGEGIVRLTARRPVVLMVSPGDATGRPPTPEVLAMFATGVNTLQRAGGLIREVHLSSMAPGSMIRRERTFPLQTLSAIAKILRELTGLPVAVY